MASKDTEGSDRTADGPTDSEFEATVSVDGKVPSPAATSTPVPEEIGGYQVLGVLGEGGMGIVYEAEQRSPRRRVALKVIRGGDFVDETRVRLFQREVETLARLRHPNIGAIYESGRTEDGRHFFAMELVRGRTLDDYIQNRPTPIDGRELDFRLRLFRMICDAVHYAHQRGVIHRDLKPGNIVITEEVISSTGDTSSASAGLPQVKVLDFGLARITDTDVNAATILSEVGKIRGTLSYMSPEQARGDAQAIDVRTDVYALGVILYEMLAGARPYDIAHSALHEAVRTICEEPPRSLTQSWSGTRRLDADVETVVTTALAKEPERRYPSAAALGEDIGRFLTSQPILARPPSAAYQLRKLVSRHRAWFGAAATVLIALVAALAVSSTMYLRAEREADRARSEAARSEQVAALLKDMLSGVGPSVALGRDTTMLREILDAAAERIATDLADQPAVEAELRRVLASTYRDLGEYDRVPLHAERSLELYREVAGVDDPATLRARHDVGLTRYLLGDLDEAERELRAVLEDQRRILGTDHADVVATTGSLVEVLLYQGRLEEADALGAPVLATARSSLGLTDERTLALLFSLAEVAADLLDFERSESLYRELIGALEAKYGPDHPNPMMVRSSYGWMLRLARRYDEAETATREALEGMRRVLGNEHAQTLIAVNNLAIILKDQGKLDEAEPYYLENVETGRRVLGDRHPEQVASVINLAAFYAVQGRYAEAEPLAAESAEILGEEVSPDYIGRGFALFTAGECRYHLGRLGEAVPDLEEAYRIMSVRFGPEHPKMAQLLEMLIDISQRRGSAADAARWRAALEARG